MTQVTAPSIAYVATQVRALLMRDQAFTEVIVGPLCSNLIPGLFKNRHNHGFRDILHVRVGSL